MELSLIKPDDMHLHLRDGAEMASVVGYTAARFGRAAVMPNLNPPVVSVDQALSYRERIVASLPKGQLFEPLMTLYLSAETTPEEVHKARRSGVIHAVKYYPAGATTHSDWGLAGLDRAEPVLGALEEAGLPLLVHGEVVDPEVDVFDREQVFIDRELAWVLDRFTGLKVVFEHVTTREAVDFVRLGPPRLAATITAHHLLLNRNALFEGGLRPHHYCLPLLKREEDRCALQGAALSGDPKFFLGTDSAPQARRAKEGHCGCAGIFTAHAAIELYAEVFEAAAALDKLEGFASRHGAAFYGLPCNGERVTLHKAPWAVSSELPFGSGRIEPFRAGGQCHWTLVD